MKAQFVYESLNEFERGQGVMQTLGIGSEQWARRHFGIDKSNIDNDYDVADYEKYLHYEGVVNYREYPIFTWKYKTSDRYVSVCDPDLNPNNRIPHPEDNDGDLSTFTTTGNTKEECIKEMKDGLDGEIDKYRL